ncbi:small acid-soluble spore protein Tlp [Lysinibacillus sp. FSL R7-0073]|jgi:small acid-soluble spore protein (thioredoxin-like protein)|uniref:Small, acid-soluble spore protein Tlp n=2 Tax=Lysinibacillus TaxID=400634 RepID=A0A2X1BBF6_9BACI|nr:MULTISPECIES: small acid-soluble spore protein Tlp [Lysinibacillus]KEK12718.1 small acid-soluble spore protein Tlp [Lysinibacillus sphaericus]KPN94676.1 small, acid-soluble spore protein Tlp [Lysinibacillus sp. ZYM-1]MCK1988096.1 small acid-soluble spore protein Tlp [Lysinibacillus fusiformis]MCR6522400.1 small acid-soluble spore protein Tlp [Lysinibacillus capsici]MDM5231922.1 small acid-soluble spore protein Tlp [Lysinibacillus pakistanensis]
MEKNTPKPDDRSDNVEKLQDMMKNTKENMEAAEEMMAYVDENERKALKQKNARREESMSGFREEILDEAAARKNGNS